MTSSVFISYPSQAADVAERICQTLEARGVRCWIAPRDIELGSSWAASIVRAIEHCRLMVLIVTHDTNSSEHVAREVECAADRELVIIPFRVSETSLTGSLEFFLKSRQWLDALSPPMYPHLNRLCETVEHILAQSPAVAASSLKGAVDPKAVIAAGGDRLEIDGADRGRNESPVQVLVHFAYFARIPREHVFVNVTNLQADGDVVVTHVWVDSPQPTFPQTSDRPLPRRLRPMETWETWIPVDSIRGVSREEIFRLARVRLSTGQVIVSRKNETVPFRGTVPGGPVGSP